MRIQYDSKIDLLYIRLDERRQKVISKRIFEGVVLDIGKGNKIVGIEILDASRHVSISKLFPVKVDTAAPNISSR
jgi:uncharacterized protein YuzE